MTGLDELIGRLEKATAGSPALDHEISVATGRGTIGVPALTNSVDAMLRLCDMDFPGASRDSMSTIVDGKRHHLWKLWLSGLDWVEGAAATDALALALAFVRALTAQKTG